MNPIFISAISSIELLYKKEFKFLSEERINHILRVAKTIKEIHSDYLYKVKRNVDDLNYSSLLKTHQDYLISIHDFNKTSYLKDASIKSKEEVTRFFEKRNKVFSMLPIMVLDVETDINRTSQKNNSLTIRFHKKLKRIRYKYLKLIKPRNKDVKINRFIPLRYYLNVELYLDIFPRIWDFHKQLIYREIELLAFFKNTFTQINNLYGISDLNEIDELLSLIHEVVEKCDDVEGVLTDFSIKKDQEIENVLISKKEHIEANYNTLGTLETRSLRNTKWYTDKNNKNISKHQIEQLSSLEISLFSISEDWCFDADLYILKNNSLLNLHSNILKDNLNRLTTIQDKLSVNTNRTIQEYEKVNNNIVKNRSHKESISEHSQKISKIFSAEELYISKVNHSKSILYALNEIEQAIIAKVDATNDKRMISEGAVAWDKMQLSKLNAVFLKDLIKFEILPRFTSDIDNLKQTVLQKIAKYEGELSNLVHISEYNLETITALLENTETIQSSEETFKIIDDGKEKILNKLSEISNVINELQDEVVSILNSDIENLITELIALTENEKVGELNLRLLKAKAISKSTMVKDKITVLLSGLYKKSLMVGQKIQEKGFRYSKQLVKIYSQEEVQASINNEISVFLSEIASTTDKLPFLYQRLFKLEPIEDGYLYFKRSAEINNLKLAYNNWLKGRFANIAITAEKGAGVTSIINYALKDNNLPYTRINFQEYNKIYRQDEFIYTLSDILDLTPLNEVELFIDELNNTNGIIVLEGLQYAYLKKVDGFETLKLLFEIISKTNKNIFWICTCTSHAWNYLNKAISIEEYFGHIIKLGEFSNEEMVEIVKKRHQVSGYGLVYLKSKQDLLNKKLSRLSQEESQSYLEKQYFEVLNSIAKGNISVAFIFWLRSIRRIENNVLYISSMSNFNISFIRDLKQEKLFCLYAILLHDGLELEGFCKVMRFSPEQGRMKLFQMVDDGLLLEKNKRYVINLLLYRSAIDALKAKNILH